MRILVLYDLPVTSKKSMRIATKFRQKLINNGFIMIQYSIYGRLARNQEEARKYISRIKKTPPIEGNIRILLITEKQYQKMIFLVGTKTPSEINQNLRFIEEV